MLNISTKVDVGELTNINRNLTELGLFLVWFVKVDTLILLSARY